MNEIKEEWKPIQNYENRYLISNLGNVKTIKTNNLLKPELRKDYLSVNLYNGKSYKHYSIHRLVAVHFIENKNNYSHVNHKDENKLNNNVNNLEWCTHKYNCNYGTAIKRSKENRSITILQYNKSLKLINTYSSLMDAERETGIPNNNICNCCKNKRKTAGGYIWKYEEEKNIG